MTEACRHSLVHGPLLLLRYTLGDLPWVKLTVARSVGCGAVDEENGTSPSDALSDWINRLLGLLEQVGKGCHHCLQGLWDL